MSTINPENTCAHLLKISAEVEPPTIEQMFDMQLQLQQFYAQKGKALDPTAMTPAERVGDITEQWRNLTLEFAELLERLPFKRWKTYTEEDFQQAFLGDSILETKFEYIDMWHFFMNIGLALGITGKEFAELYYLKNKENYDRQNRGY